MRMFTFLQKLLNNKHMLKKVLSIALIFCLFYSFRAYAEEDWSCYDNIDNAWDGQKAITNKQFEDTMNALQAEKKRKEEKQKEKAIKKFKGESLLPQLDAHNETMINEKPEDVVDEGQLINIPVDFVVNGQAVERGFYKVLGEKKDDGVYIMLYQAHSLKAKIKARETNDDFNEEYIQFVRLLPFNENHMKIIFGSIAFNAVAYITFVEPEPMF